MSGKGEMTVVGVAMFKANARATHAASADLSEKGSVSNLTLHLRYEIAQEGILPDEGLEALPPTLQC